MYCRAAQNTTELTDASFCPSLLLYYHCFVFVQRAANANETLLFYVLISLAHCFFKSVSNVVLR